MEFSWLEDFLALVDSGNFNRAAEARHLTQPAFSRRIRALEDWVGAPLFDRATHRVTLTPAGDRFRPLAEDLVRRLLQGREEIRQASATAAASLRFAATHVLSLTFFPVWLRSLEARTRLGPVHLVSDTMRACAQIMRAGQAQFLLCHHHPALPAPLDADQFRSIQVGDDVLLPVAAPDDAGRPRFALADAATDAPTDASVPHLAYSPDSALGRIVAAARGGADAARTPDPVFTSHLATVLRAMAADGRGIAWLPESLIADDLARRTLVRAGDGAWAAPVEIRLYRAKARQSPAAEAFWSALDGR
ncbi:MAG TPA: LysR family transcriptional regulator [Aliidongia sp.]|nr:LysR family transcriptional regulator [Aliidongia sp.]